MNIAAREHHISYSKFMEQMARVRIHVHVIWSTHNISLLCHSIVSAKLFVISIPLIPSCVDVVVNICIVRKIFGLKTKYRTKQ